MKSYAYIGLAFCYAITQCDEKIGGCVYIQQRTQVKDYQRFGLVLQMVIQQQRIMEDVMPYLDGLKKRC